MFGVDANGGDVDGGGGWRKVEYCNVPGPL